MFPDSYLLYLTPALLLFAVIIIGASVTDSASKPPLPLQKSPWPPAPTIFLVVITALVIGSVQEYRVRTAARRLQYRGQYRHGNHQHGDANRFWISIVAATSIIAIVMFSDWEEWLNLLLGFWLIVSPWLLGFPHTKAMHVSIGAGIFITFMAALELWLVNYDPQQATAPG